MKIEFMGNYFWPLLVTISASIILGIVSIIKKKREQKIKIRIKNKNKQVIPQFVFKTNKKDELKLIQDENLKSKITLSKQLIKSKQKEFIDIGIIENKETTKNKIELEVSKNINSEKVKELKKKIQILLSREIHPALNKNNNIITVINNISNKLKQQYNNSAKIVFQRKENPKIDFYIYIDYSEMKNIAKIQNIEYGELINEMRFSDKFTISIFNDKILCNMIIPEFIERIYELEKNYKFDLETKNWEKLYTYEVGIG